MTHVGVNRKKKEQKASLKGKGQQVDRSPFTVISKKAFALSPRWPWRVDHAHRPFACSDNLPAQDLVNAVSMCVCYYCSINAPSRDTAIKYAVSRSIPASREQRRPPPPGHSHPGWSHSLLLFQIILAMKKPQRWCVPLGRRAGGGVSVTWDSSMRGSACSRTLKSPERRRNYGSPGRHSTL